MLRAVCFILVIEVPVVERRCRRWRRRRSEVCTGAHWTRARSASSPATRSSDEAQSSAMSENKTRSWQTFLLNLRWAYFAQYTTQWLVSTVGAYLGMRVFLVLIHGCLVTADHKLPQKQNKTHNVNIYSASVAGYYCRGWRHYMYLHEERDEVLHCLAVDAVQVHGSLQQRREVALLISELT